MYIYIYISTYTSIIQDRETLTGESMYMSIPSDRQRHLSDAEHNYVVCTCTVETYKIAVSRKYLPIMC